MSPLIPFLIAAPIMAAYFYLFHRTMLLLPKEERQRFIREAGLPAWRRVLALVPFVLLFFVSSAYLRVVLALWWLIQLVLDTRAHHHKLEVLNFDPRFRLQLRRITYLVGVGISVVSVGLVLQAR